jgi:hypothetical protein
LGATGGLDRRPAAASARATSVSTERNIDPTEFDAAVALGNEEFLRAAVAQRGV